MAEENVFRVLKGGDGWIIVTESLNAEGDLDLIELAIPGCTRHEAKRITRALNQAFELGKQTAVTRIARGLESDRKTLLSLIA